MKPEKTLLFMLAVFALLGGSVLLTPMDGIKAGKFTFNMPTLGEMFIPEVEETVDVSKIIENQFDLDSLVEMEIDSLSIKPIEEKIKKASYDSLIQSIHKIEITDEGRKNLTRFFRKIIFRKPVKTKTTKSIERFQVQKK